ncbi:MAG: hypothetical protein U0165_02685 [Polyangiaceae bacterium]
MSERPRGLVHEQLLEGAPGTAEPEHFVRRVPHVSSCEYARAAGVLSAW